MTTLCRLLILVLTACLCATAQALAFAPGEVVLGQYAGERYWYPGRIESSTPDSVTIQYLDGDHETRPIDQVKPLDWRIGTKVECNWQNKGDYYSGVIVSATTETINIDYDDGDKETTTIGACRSL